MISSGLPLWADLFEDRHQVAEVADLLLVDQDQGVFEQAVHRRRAVDEVGRDVALVELHAIDVLDLGVGRLAFLDGDHAVLADPLQGVGQQLADRLVVVGADRADGGDFVLAGDRLGHVEQLFGGRFDGLVDAAADGRGIAAGDDVPQAFLEDRAGQHGGRGGAVAGQVGGLLGHFDHELGAHVLEAVFQLDFLGDGDAVLGDGRAAEGLVDDHIPAGRAHRDRDGVGEFFDALEHFGAGVIVEQQLFGH